MFTSRCTFKESQFLLKASQFKYKTRLIIETKLADKKKNRFKQVLGLRQRSLQQLNTGGGHWRRRNYVTPSYTPQRLEKWKFLSSWPKKKLQYQHPRVFNYFVWEPQKTTHKQIEVQLFYFTAAKAQGHDKKEGLKIWGTSGTPWQL